MRSIIGRFFEHSRIFHFAAGEDDPLEGEFYIGSADWMYRNLSRRVEVVTPVLDREARKKLWEILDICLKDRRQAWVLQADGGYTRVESTEDGQTSGTHRVLMELCRRRAEQ